MVRKVDLSSDAVEDINEVLDWTRKRFGTMQMKAYQRLIKLALREIRFRPEDILFRQRPDILPDARL